MYEFGNGEDQQQSFSRIETVTSPMNQPHNMVASQAPRHPSRGSSNRPAPRKTHTSTSANARKPLKNLADENARLNDMPYK